AVGFRAVGMNLRVNAAVDHVIENVPANEFVARRVILLRFVDQARQPMRMFIHPSLLSTGERRATFRSARIFNPLAVKGVSLPLVAVQLIHADGDAELLRYLGKSLVPLLD